MTATVLPSITDAATSDITIGGITPLTPPEGYAYGDNFRHIVQVPGQPAPNPFAVSTEQPTARDQAVANFKMAVLDNRGIDEIPAQMFDMPHRMHLTAEDFGITSDHRDTASDAMYGHPEAFAVAARALYLFILLMDQDMHTRVRVGLNGLPHREVEGKDERTGRLIYKPAITYRASRWEVDHYASAGVKSGMLPMRGYYQELARAAWLTHLMPNLVFSRRPELLPAREATTKGKESAAARLDPEKTPRRKRALEWLEAAKKIVDRDLAKGGEPGRPVKGGK